MAYFDIFTLSSDSVFQGRVAACYAVETVDQTTAEHPGQWAISHAWEMASQPGFGDAYAYAINSGNTEPGKDPAVITDEQILSAVQSILNA